MAENVDDVFEKYGNLFRLNITPYIERLYLSPPHEEKKSVSSKEALSIIKKEGLVEQAAKPAKVKDAIRALFCQQVAKSPNFKLNRFKTVMLEKKPSMEYGDKAVIVYPGIKFRVIYIGNEFFFCLDHAAIVVNYLCADEVKRLIPDYSFNQTRGFYESGVEGWKPGIIEEIEGREALVQTEAGLIRVEQSKFLPDIPSHKISKLLAKKGIRVDFDREIKRLGLLTVENPSRQRLQKIIDIAKTLKSNFFPIKIGNYEIDIESVPARLLSPTFDVRTDLTEPFSIFDHEDETKRSQLILEGLTRHGSFDKPKKEIKTVILTTKGRLPMMHTLLDRLNTGADKYLGMGKTFGSQLAVMEVLTTENLNQYVGKCGEFVRRPDFQEADIFLVSMPEEEGKASYESPYYEVKKFLIKNGIPSQMVDDDTLQNPRFKDLNIALNIFSKAGYTPWVLDETLKDADLFIGLSYSSITRNRLIERMMAYVNIFDKYGRWKFYQGDVEAFPYEERHKHYKEIIKASLDRHKAENPGIEIKKIHIHYTQKMKKKDLEAINEQVTTILPDCEVFFVYINRDMPIRLFDAETADGSMERRSYVDIGNNQFFMSTTGANIFGQRGMGTPKILTITVRNQKNPEKVDVQSVAQHILSLTRLNWASTRNFCHEPITTKFAGDISYFMNVFMKDSGFHVSERIRNKPWFL